jgi:hypothetical protein
MVQGIQEFLGLPKLTPGRRQEALLRMRTEAAARGYSDLVLSIDQALALEKEALQMELKWSRWTEDHAQHEAGAREVDSLLDRTLTGLYESLLLKERSFPGLARPARTLLDAFFPQGTGPVTHLPYVDQHALVSTLLEGLSKAPHRDALVALRLEDWLERLQEINRQYGLLLMRPGRLTFGQVMAADKAGHIGMLTVVARVLGLHPSNSEADMQARHALLAPYLEQKEAFANLRARRRNEAGEEPAPEAPEASTELVPVTSLSD